MENIISNTFNQRYNPANATQQSRSDMQYFSLEDFSDFFDYEIMKQFKDQQP